VIERIQGLFEEVLSIRAPAPDADIVDGGLLDSLALVTIIAEIESEFEVELPLDDFDVDRFRSVGLIVAFLAEVLPGLA
jgi:acyl carrier protein